MSEDVEDLTKPPKGTVVPYPETPWRYTPEMVVRSLLSQVDRIEDLVVVFRLHGKNSLLMNYSSDISPVDLLVASATTRALAEQRMGIAAPMSIPHVEKGPEEPK